MKLWVLRHGEAHHQAPTDAERELTEAGRAEVLRSAAQRICKGWRWTLSMPAPMFGRSRRRSWSATHSVMANPSGQWRG